MLRHPRRFASLAALATTGACLAAASPCAAEAIYGGTTSKARAYLEPIVVRADAPSGTVTSVVLAWAADCSDKTVQAYSTELTVRPETPGLAPPPNTLILDSAPPGRFSGHSDASATFADGRVFAIAMKLDGTLESSAGRGTLSVDAKITEPDGTVSATCTTGSIPWRATRGPVIYGGVTSRFHEPVVVQLNAARTRVKNIYFGWDTDTCTTDQGFRIGDWLVQFGLRR